MVAGDPLSIFKIPEFQSLRRSSQTSAAGRPSQATSAAVIVAVKVLGALLGSGEDHQCHRRRRQTRTGATPMAPPAERRWLSLAEILSIEFLLGYRRRDVR